MDIKEEKEQLEKVEKEIEEIEKEIKSAPLLSPSFEVRFSHFYDDDFSQNKKRSY